MKKEFHAKFRKVDPNSDPKLFRSVVVGWEWIRNVRYGGDMKTMPLSVVTAYMQVKDERNI